MGKITMMAGFDGRAGRRIFMSVLHVRMRKYGNGTVKKVWGTVYRCSAVAPFPVDRLLRC